MAPGGLLLVVSSLGAGGTERVVATLAGAWAARGTKVTVATLQGAQSASFYPLHPSVRLLPLGIARPSRHAAGAAANNVRALRVLRRTFRAARPDAVIGFGDSTNVVCVLAATGLGLPVYVAERCNPRLSPSSRIWRPLSCLAYPRAAAVVVQTEAAAAYFRVRGLGRVAVIPNPVAPPGECRAEPPKGERPLLLGVGRLIPEKGFDLLIGAFARLAARFPDWSLIVLGEGGERERLWAAAVAGGVADRVSLPGATPDPWSWYRRASLFALPSRTEGFPNALVEAMASGLAVVSADCPFGPGEIVRHDRDGLLVPPGDEAALASALGLLMGDSRARARLGGEARAAAERFAPERVLAMWNALLPSAVRGC